MPILIAGGTSGKLKRDIHYRSYTQDNLNKTLLSVVRSMGITQTSLGEGDSYEESGLSAIEI